MENNSVKQEILDGKAFMGIELGSTRIKAVLIDARHNLIASGSHAWENRFENKVWTYSLDEVWSGLQDSYQKLADDVQAQYGVPLTRLGAIGFSAMMHGYLAFDKAGGQLVPFRTWRNTTTEEAALRLTEQFGFNVPQRWSVAHLYQAVLNNEAHVRDVAFLTTLSGYVHWRLTGQKCLGVGDASGMFPIDSSTNDYDEGMVRQFDALTADKSYPWRLRDLLPPVLAAGEAAGTLTAAGAALLDVSGRLQPGIPLCPPEGDAGTGMVATNSVAARTGNVSAGTSIFAMVVLEAPLSRVYPEIDMVTTPSGKPVAMVHCNNCTSDFDAWVNLFRDFNKTMGNDLGTPALYDGLYAAALKGDADCGGLLAYNYVSGEPITGMDEGRPLFLRMAGSRFTLANFMRAHLFSTMATLRIGMEILFEKEQVRLDQLLGHGGLFKTENVGQRLMAAAMNTPVAVMETAGEGGAWGIALLAAYLQSKGPDETLEAYLENKVFACNKSLRAEPSPRDVEGFDKYLASYKAGLAVERAAVDAMKGESKCWSN